MNHKIKLLSCLDCIIITFLVVPSLVFADSGNQIDINAEAFNLTQAETEKAAALFLVSDIVNNVSTGWSRESRIDSIELQYDINNTKSVKKSLC